MVNSDHQVQGQLAGKVSLVTGGGGDLGLAIVVTLALAGSRLILADVDGDRAQKAAADLVSRGLQADYLTMDVADERSVAAGFEKVVGELGAIDILVNNAGVAARRSSVDLPIEDWNRVLAVNLTGTFLCSRAAARVMLARDGGAIVNVASIMGLIGNSLFREGIVERTPMGRLARPNEIASAVLFLASDAASFITGTIMTIDGGWTAI